MSHIHDMKRPPTPMKTRLLVWSLATIALVVLLDRLGVIDLSRWMR